MYTILYKKDDGKTYTIGSFDLEIAQAMWEQIKAEGCFMVTARPS